MNSAQTRSTSAPGYSARELALLGSTFVVQLLGVGTWAAAARLDDGRAMVPLALGGTLAVALGWTIRRAVGASAAPLLFALVATGFVASAFGLESGLLCFCLSTVPLACVYHADVIGELASIAPYSGLRTAPWGERGVQFVGYLLLLGAPLACAFG